MTRAVVFGYHDVGVRCLRVLLAHGIEVALVVTHEDSATENIFFGSVAGVAGEVGLPVVTPEDPNTPAFVERIRALDPDFLFSFYYRKMLSPALLACARRGAFNMHGSLLPKFRGRAPVNWAVLKGERETGATLHAMTEKPDRGGIAGRFAVPILPDDTAGEVFDKVTVAAELLLDATLPGLLAGTTRLETQDQAAASYHGRRRPEDGRIDWSSSVDAHNLVRAVAPPYPGAFTVFGGREVKVLRTRRLSSPPPLTGHGPAGAPFWYAGGPRIVACCADGGWLEILACAEDGQTLDPRSFASRFGVWCVPDPSPAAAGPAAR